MNWDKVSDWDMENGEVRFFDDEGKLINTAWLDDIIDSYIEHMKELDRR